MALYDLSLPELEAYLPVLDEPADLDGFWTRTLDEARGHDLALRAEPVDTGLRLIETLDVTFAGFGGDPIRAWLTRPAGSSDGLPAVVEYLGYGGGRGFAHERLAWAAAGYAHLLMDTRGQGSTWGSGGVTPDPQGSGPAAPGVMTRGILAPDDYYFRRLITDGVRAVDAVRALSFVDPAQVAVLGASQGGGVALGVAGLVRGLVGVMADVPFLCHVGRALGLTDSYPYREVVDYLAVHRDQRDRVLRTLSYVDGVHLGRRADAPTLFSVALRDETCPPSTVYAAYNHYGALAAGARPAREIEVYEFNRHEGGEGYQIDRQLRWLADVLAGGAGGCRRHRAGCSGSASTDARSTAP